MKFVWMVEVRDPAMASNYCGDAYSDKELAMRVLEREQKRNPDLQYTLRQVQLWHRDSI